jgi:hypothetical protein
MARGEHVAHLGEWNDLIIKYLGLPLGWRLRVKDDCEAVWFDREVVKAVLISVFCQYAAHLKMRRNQQIQICILDLKTFAQIFVAQTTLVGVHSMA